VIRTRLEIDEAVEVAIDAASADLARAVATRLHIKEAMKRQGQHCSCKLCVALKEYTRFRIAHKRGARAFRLGFYRNSGWVVGMANRAMMARSRMVNIRDGLLRDAIRI
jgi:hypothetical protein